MHKNKSVPVSENLHLKSGPCQQGEPKDTAGVVPLGEGWLRALLCPHPLLWVSVSSPKSCPLVWSLVHQSHPIVDAHLLANPDSEHVVSLDIWNV